MTPDHLRLPRSSQWPALRQQWLADHPRCAACGSSKALEVHHKVPVHVSRSMELDPTNLITLCQNEKDTAHQCHLMLGHLGNWFNFNRNIEKQASDALLRLYPREGQHSIHPPKTLEPQTPTPIAPQANPAAAPAGDITNEVPPNISFRRRRRT